MRNFYIIVVLQHLYFNNKTSSSLYVVIEDSRYGNSQNTVIFSFILLHEKFLQFDWLRAVVFQLNLKYLHVKVTNLLWVVV